MQAVIGGHTVTHRTFISNISLCIIRKNDRQSFLQVSLITESKHLQTILSTYGFITETPDQVDPIEIWPSQELVKVYIHLGSNKKLGLSGRPKRPIGLLGTSKLYR